jgi:homoisocitrate dehydrogenase
MPIITFINGDGIGNEVIPAARRVLESLNLPVTIQEAEAGFSTFERLGNALPEETLAKCEASDAVLFGATQSPMEKVVGYSSPILTLRKHFDLYANLRPAVQNDIDMLIVRENTEGMYSRRERVEDDGNTAILERVVTAKASERIVQLACELAMTRRKHLTIVHKANVLKETCGLFRRVAFEVTTRFPDLNVQEQLVDSMAMFMVMQPQKYDVVVTTNLFGDILSDLAAGLTGGLGIAPSANVGSGKTAVFEPVHGSAPDIAGKGISDPRAAILSLSLLLDTVGFPNEAKQVRDVAYRTEHTGTTNGTADAVIRGLGR